MRVWVLQYRHHDSPLHDVLVFKDGGTAAAYLKDLEPHIASHSLWMKVVLE